MHKHVLCHLCLPSSLPSPRHLLLLFFFFNDTATTEIYTLSLHDALPISLHVRVTERPAGAKGGPSEWQPGDYRVRSEEHTSELQSRLHLVCRLLLEKKKKKHKRNIL